jgi:foldase protein PrsA
MLWQLPLLSLLAAQASLLDVPARYLPTAPARDQVVARVNGVEVKAQDVEKLLWSWRGNEVLQDVVSAMLIQQEAQRVGAQVSDEEVEAELQAQLRGFEQQLQGQAPLDQALMDQGFPRSRLYLRIHTQMLADKIALRQFDPAEFVSISTIVIQPESEQASAVALAISRAEEVYQKLQGGLPWAEAVAQATTNEAVRKNDGFLGWRQLSLFPQSARAEFATLRIGGVTKPVQTDNGIQIFRLEKLGRDASEEERVELREAYLSSARQALVQRLRSEAKIEKLLPVK